MGVPAGLGRGRAGVLRGGVVWWVKSHPAAASPAAAAAVSPSTVLRVTAGLRAAAGGAPVPRAAASSPPWLRGGTGRGGPSWARACRARCWVTGQDPVTSSL